MKNAWERLENESDTAFSAFKIYLELDERSYPKVAEKLSKSLTLIKRWAKKYDWKNRAVAWDNSLLEEVRQKTKQNLGKIIKRQLKISEMIQNRTAEEIQKKDLSKTSLKVLSEAFHSALQTQWQLFEKIGVIDEISTTETEIEDVIIQIPAKNERL